MCPNVHCSNADNNLRAWKQPKCSLTEEGIKRCGKKKKKRGCGTYTQWSITQPLKRMK